MTKSPKRKSAKKKSLARNPFTYVAAVGAACAIGVGSWALLSQPEPESTPVDPGPKTISLSVDSPAYAWLSSMKVTPAEAEASPDSSPSASSDEGGKAKKTSSRTPPLVEGLSCSVLKDAPRENLFTGTGSLNDEDFRIQVLAPGTSGKIFSKIVQDSGSCWPKDVDEKKADGYRYVQAGDGYIALIGDTLVYTGEKDVNKATKLFDSLRKSVADSTCISTEVKASDYTRNKHFSGDDYTGKIQVETVDSTIPLDNLPTVTVPKLVELEDPDAEEPEGPLDPSVPSKPEEVTKPTFDKAPETRDKPFTAEARYQVADVEGPGCGWGWTAWELPTETDEQLAGFKDAGIASATAAANNEADAYMNKQTDWVASQLTDAQSANKWNTYANKFNNATKKWDWLEKKRKDLKPKWDKYVERHNYWNDFDELKEKANDDYRDAQDKCREDQRARDEWDAKYDDSDGDGGGNTGVPERPKGCSKDPAEPKILSEEKPKEPIPPTLEAGVTVPDSWDQPK